MQLLLSTLRIAALLSLFAISGCQTSITQYDVLASRLQDTNNASRLKAEEDLANLLKRQLYEGNPEDIPSKNIFLLGHFIDPKTADIAISISTEGPLSGNLMFLTKRGEHYALVGPTRRLGYVESMESVKLFQGPRDQVVLNLIGGGTGWRHWAKDIYRWDGDAIRIIWVWTRRNLDVNRPEGPHGETIEEVITSNIQFLGFTSLGANDIVTRTITETGRLAMNRSDIETVITRSEAKQVHRWDEHLYYFVSQYGEIVRSTMAVKCWRGMTIEPISTKVEIEKGRTIALLQTPGFDSEGKTYHAMVEKELFCQVPRDAVKIRND